MRDRAGCCASTRCGGGLRREAAEFASRERGSDYNPFNLLMVSRTEAFVAYNRGASIEVVEIKPGLHLLSNLDVNDFECPKISASYGKFAELGKRADFQRDPIGQRAALGALLADHNTQLDSRSGRPNALCLHLENYGTRSSSLIFMRGETPEIAHYFAPGPPCRTAYAPAMVPRGGRRILNRRGKRALNRTLTLVLSVKGRAGRKSGGEVGGYAG